MTLAITRTDLTAADFRGEARRSGNANQARCCLAIALVLDGRSRTEAAQSAGMERQTLRDWVHRYSADGVAGLLDRAPPVRPGLLSLDQLAAFDRLVEVGPDLAVDGVVRWRPVDLKGTLAYVWVRCGTRPCAVQDTRYVSAYLFGAVCPSRGVGAALVMSRANAEGPNQHLAETAYTVTPGVHAVSVMDGAGCYKSDDLVIPINISLRHLPPYVPELNPLENIWQYLRRNKLAHRLYDTYEAIIDACCDA